jgi:hypothetical protein
VRRSDPEFSEENPCLPVGQHTLAQNAIAWTSELASPFREVRAAGEFDRAGRATMGRLFRVSSENDPGRN